MLSTWYRRQVPYYWREARDGDRSPAARSRDECDTNTPFVSDGFNKEYAVIKYNYGLNCHTSLISRLGIFKMRATQSEVE